MVIRFQSTSGVQMVEAVEQLDLIVSEIKSRFETAKAANSALREVGGYAAGHALGYHDALGELLEYLADRGEQRH